VLKVIENKIIINTDVSSKVFGMFTELYIQYFFYLLSVVDVALQDMYNRLIMAWWTVRCWCCYRCSNVVTRVMF
jgi:hypothetical protein